MNPPSARILLTLATCAFVALTATNALAQLAPNQTNGFGNDKLDVFTYKQKF